MKNCNIVSVAFAAVLASAGGAHAENAPANPATSAKVIYPDPENNTYHQLLPGGVYYKTGESNVVRRVIDCTLGTLHLEMVVGSKIAQGGDKIVQPTSPISVTSLSPKAQDVVRRNCSSNGLQATF